MNLKRVGVSTSASPFSLGHAGKGTTRQNPQPLTLEQFIDAVAELGFGGVEAPLARFVPGLEDACLHRLFDQLRQRQMRFFMDADAALDAEQIRALMPLATRFGSPLIRIKTSDVLECARQKLGRPWLEHVQHVITVLRNVAPELRQHGLRIAVENHQDLDSTDLAQIVSAVGSDVVGVNFDVGNALATCEDPLTFAQKLGPAIINVHLKDYRIVRSPEGFSLVRCPVGHGAVDFPAVLAALAKTSPDATLVVELGALEARYIKWLIPQFWSEIQPRSAKELLPFFQLLERATVRTADASQQTPWEAIRSADDILAYEREGLVESAKYLEEL